LAAENSSLVYRTIGPLAFVVLLARVPLVVIAVAAAVLFDGVIDGAMREAMRYAVLDKPAHLIWTGAALLFACVTLRFSCEAIISLVAPDLQGRAAQLAALLPRVCAILAGLAVGIPAIILAYDSSSNISALGERVADGTLVDKALQALTGNNFFALIAGLVYVAIGAGAAAWGRGLRFRGDDRNTQGSGLALHIAMGLTPLFVASIIAFGAYRLIGYDPLKGTSAFAFGILDRYAEFGWGLLVVELLGIYLACVGVRLALQIFIGFLFAADERSATAGGFGAWLLPRIAALAIGVALALQISIEPPGPQAEIQFGARAALYQQAVGLLFALAGLAASALVARGKTDSPSLFDRAAAGWQEGTQRFSGFRHRWQWLYLVGFALSLAVVAVFFWVWLPQAAQTVGAAAVVLFWAGAAATLLFPLAYFSHMSRLPLLGLMFGMVAAFSALDLNDNHTVRGTPETATLSPQTHRAHEATAAGAETFELDVAFKDWLESRSDIDAYKESGYPVFLIATEGGGLRAAYFTAQAMSALQDMCPAFAEHTLAISGVSGGSVGAAVFATAVSQANQATQRDHAKPCNLDAVPPDFRNVTEPAVANDLLSPLFAGLLFPDMFQRALPKPLSWLDRARALEYAFQGGWAACEPDQDNCGLARPLSALHPPQAAVHVPHLILNTTEVETGRMVPVSTLPLLNEREADLTDPSNPFVRFQRRYFSRSEDRDGDGAADGLDRGDIRVSTAAMLSARFPYVTPAGRVNDRFGNTYRLVDGGYFENSGSWIITQLWQHLYGQITRPTQASDVVRRARLYVIILRSTPCTRRTMSEKCEEDVQTRRAAGWNELMTPFRTLLNTRSARAEYLRRDLDAAMKAIAGDKANLIQIGFENAPGTEVPLTWLLSHTARDAMKGAINDMVGRVSNAVLQGRHLSTNNAGSLLGRNYVDARRAQQAGALTGPIETILCSLISTDAALSSSPGAGIEQQSQGPACTAPKQHNGQANPQ